VFKSFCYFTGGDGGAPGDGGGFGGSGGDGGAGGGDGNGGGGGVRADTVAIARSATIIVPADAPTPSSPTKKAPTTPNCILGDVGRTSPTRQSSTSAVAPIVMDDAYLPSAFCFSTRLLFLFING
jgi:hypothetical protein